MLTIDYWGIEQLQPRYNCIKFPNRIHKKILIFSNFKLVFEILTEKQKKMFKELRGVNIDYISMRFISMDLSQRALQTNRKLFSNFELVFEFLAENLKFFKRITHYCIYIRWGCGYS